MTTPASVTLELEGDLQAALRLRATREGISVSAVANAILRRSLTAEIEEASGTPPLAAVIQEHHNRQLREGAQGRGSSVS